jgi:transcription termination/antitermination protein NusG
VFELTDTNLGTITEPQLTIPEPAVPRWYAVYTRSNFEKRVMADLDSKGVNHFLPLIQERHQWKDRKKAIEVPVFPGYVFARFVDRDENRLRVLRSKGVVRILGADHKIEPIPDAEIESIRLLMTSGVPFLAYPFLHEGARVRVTKGALRGLEGILIRFKNQVRLVLSVSLLAQSVALEIGVQDVEAI